MTSGCKIFQSLATKHEHICQAEATIIVHERLLWDEYTQAARKNYLRRLEENAFGGTESRREAVEYVPGYSQRFGGAKTEFRDSLPGQIIRNDLFLYKGNVLVAQYVDYIVGFKTIASQTGSSCVTAFPHLYLEHEGLD